MPSSASTRRPPPEIEDFEEEEDLPKRRGQEKTKQLLLDLVGRWHWICLGLLIGLLCGLYYVSKAPKVYQATATVLVKQRTATVMSRDQVEEMDLGSAEGLNTVAELIRRPGLMEKVASRSNVRELPGLMPAPVEWLPGWSLKWLGRDQLEAEGGGPTPSPPALGGRIASWTRISIRPRTRLLDISVTHRSPEVAMTVANAIAVEYQAERTGDRSDGRNTSTEILVAEREQARDRLQTAQNALANYQRALITLKDLEQREDFMAQLVRRYKDKHPRMIAAKADLETYEERFLEEFDAARTSQADRAYWESTETDWEAASADNEERLRTGRRLLLARGSVLESEIDSQTRVFNSILTRIQESDINQQAVEADVEIRSPALLPGGAVGPDGNRAIMTASATGLGAGLLLAFLLIRIDNKLHTVAQAERESGLPVLAAIPDIQPKVLAAIIRKRKIDPDTVSAERKAWDPHIVFREGLGSTTFAEMFRVLRASVSLLGDEKTRKITLFTSGLPGEGKTFISGNFAIAAAQQGKRTLLIDLDLRKPSVHKLFGVARDVNGVGATEVLAGQATFHEGIYKNSGQDNLHLILSGKQAPSPGELLNVFKLMDLLNAATAEYEVVVIDSAPLLAVPDTRMVAPLADNLCLVTRAEYVPKGALRRVLSLLESDRNLPVGMVFNGFEEKRRLIGENYSYGNYQTNRYGRAYRYGYGNYGNYGAYGSEET
jgi:tyrosine-protein kinase Etk/Wzc